jgi:uncharacterized membrane protein
MRSKQSYIFYSILFAYALLAIAHSVNQGFWHDEIYTKTFMHGISAYTFEESTLAHSDTSITVSDCKEILDKDYYFENFKRQIEHEGHPPLYFILLKFWTYIIGNQEFGLRSFSIFCGLLSFIIFYRTIRILYPIEQNKSILTIILIICNPYLFYYFTEARMYALAFLLATCYFHFWIKINKKSNTSNFDFTILTLAAISLIYTHYYGVFFLISLGIYDFFTNGLNKKIISLCISAVVFLPWLAIIQTQTNLHQIHWTDGSYAFLKSTIGFMLGGSSLLFSPMSNAKTFENITMLLIAIILITSVISKYQKLLRELIIPVSYFLMIFIFDALLDHHTIAVSRYYMFLLIPFYWAILSLLNKGWHKLYLAITIGLSLCGIFNIALISSKELAPKQMIREVANYIDNRHTPENTILVVEPGGPMIWGLSNYLNQDFRIISASTPKNIERVQTIIYIDEMLGDVYWENHLDNQQQEKINFVPFVGVFLYE